MRYLIILLLVVSNFAYSRQLINNPTQWTGKWDIVGGGTYNGAPLSTDTVTINSNGTIAASVTTPVCKKLDITAGTLTVLSTTAVAIGGNFTMTGGGLTLGNNVVSIVPFPNVTGTISLTGGTVSYASNTPSQVINTSPTYYILNINRNSKTISTGTLNVANSLTFSSNGTTLNSSINIIVGGSISGTTGTLALTGSSILDIKGDILSNLTCSSGTSVKYTGNGTQTGKSVTYGSLFIDGTSNNVSFSSNFSVTNITVANGTTLTLNADFPSHTTVSIGLTSTVSYIGDGNIEPLTYGNLSISDNSPSTASRTVLNTTNTIVSGNLSLSAGTSTSLTLADAPITFEVDGNITGNSSCTLDAGNGYFKLKGSFAAAIVFATTNSTIEYASASPTSQSVRSEYYNNLILSGTGDKAFLTGTVQIDGTLTSTTSGAISYNTNNIIEFNSSTLGQIIPAFTFNKLLVSSANKVLSGNVIVSKNAADALFLDAATITTGSNYIRILSTNSLAIGQTNPSTDYIIGNLARNFAANSTNLPFPLGDADPTKGSLPVQAYMTSLTVGYGTTVSSGYLTISSTFTNPASYSGFAGANFASTNDVCDRYWTVTNTGFTTYTSLKTDLNFVNPGDLGSGASDPTIFFARINKSGTWSDGTLSAIAATSATISSMTLASGSSMDLWLGELSTGKCISIATPANWNSAATWSCGRIPVSSDSVTISSGHTITLDGTTNVAAYLKIDGIAVCSTGTTTNVGTFGVLVSSTGSISRTGTGTPTISTTGDFTINNTTAINTSVILAMTGVGQSLLTNQASLTIPRLAINSSSINNTVPNLTIGTNLTSSANSNNLVQSVGSILTLRDAATGITIDGSASTSEVIYDLSGTQTICRGTYYKLTLSSNAGGAKTTSFPSGTTSTTVTNELNLQCGSASSHNLVLDLTTTTLTGTGATLTMGANTSLDLGDATTSAAIAFPSSFSTYAFNSASTVKYLANTAQTISSTPTYQNLNITTGTSSVTKTLGGNTSVVNALTIVNGTGAATLSLGTNTLNIAGTISGTGTLLCPTNSTVNYNSSSTSQTVLAQQFANLTFSNAATKNLPSTGVLISGNLTSNSSLSIPTNSTLTLNGTSGNQVINTPLSFYNLYKTGAATVSFSTSNTTVTNLFSVKDGSGLISPNSLLTIANGASLFDSSSTTSSFVTGSAGNVNILKTATGTNRSFYLSSPVSTFTSTDLNAGQAASVLKYDSDATPSDITTVYKNTCAPALRQNGSYQGLYKATTGSLTIGKGYSVLQATDKNLTYIGNPNFGTVTFSPITSVNRTTADGAGYAWCATTNGLALLGNPYPTTIDWGLVYASASGINASAKIWNGTNYTDVLATSPTLSSRLIKAGQGFIIQATSVPANSLSFANSQRVLGTNDALLRTEDDLLKVELKDTQDKDLVDVLTINFNEEASDKYDIKYDSYDLPGIPEVPSIVAIVDGYNLSTTQFPKPTTNKVIPISLDFNKESTFEISISNPTSIPSNMKVYLVDQSKKLEYDLSESTVIPFNKGSFGNYEVQLRTSDNQTQYTSVASSSNKVYSANDKIVVENNNDNLSDIAIYDVTGKLVATKNSVSKGKYEIELSNKNQTQMYIVKLSSNTATNTYKVILY